MTVNLFLGVLSEHYVTSSRTLGLLNILSNLIKFKGASHLHVATVIASHETVKLFSSLRHLKFFLRLFLNNFSYD